MEKSARRSRGCPSDRRHTATHGDTRRHTATFGDRESGAERHLATPPDITRHAGLGLHNRRLPVRFLSHLPRKPEFMGFADLWLPQNGCSDPSATPPRTSPQICERSSLSDGPPGTPDLRSLCPINSNLAVFIIAPGHQAGSRSDPLALDLTLAHKGPTDVCIEN
jgi:hypothetical protein